MLHDFKQVINFLLQRGDILRITRVEILGGTQHGLLAPGQQKDSTLVLRRLHIIAALLKTALQDQVGALYQINGDSCRCRVYPLGNGVHPRSSRIDHDMRMA